MKIYLVSFKYIHENKQNKNKVGKIITICVLTAFILSTPFLLIFAQSNHVITEGGGGGGCYLTNSTDVHTHKVYGKVWNAKKNKLVWTERQIGKNTSYRIALDSAYNNDHGAVIAMGYTSEDSNCTINGTEYKIPQTFVCAELTRSEGGCYLFKDDHRWNVEKEQIEEISDISNDTAIIGKKIPLSGSP